MFNVTPDGRHIIGTIFTGYTAQTNSVKELMQ